MFKRFDSSFSMDAVFISSQAGLTVQSSDPMLHDFLLRYAGSSFNSGLYRVVGAETLQAIDAFVAEAFQSFSKRLSAFAYDWLGRIFAIDTFRFEGGQPAVLMLEPGTGKALEIPCNLLTFHENELVDFSENALAPACCSGCSSLPTGIAAFDSTAPSR